MQAQQRDLFIKTAGGRKGRPHMQLSKAAVEVSAASFDGGGRANR